MKRFFCLLGAAFLFALLLLPVTPAQGVDTKGKVGLGLHAGLYKLGLTDHSDAWTPGGFLNADLKYGVSSKWAIGAEGNWMKTYLADLSDPAKRHDGAGMSFEKIEDGPMQEAFIAGLFAQYRFLGDSDWSPYVTVGSGMYFWKWTDKDGNTLMSDGTEDLNRWLSDKRAKAVQDYLVQKGVPAAQLTAKGYGESQPVADNETSQGKAKNRRVELKRM